MEVSVMLTVIVEAVVLIVVEKVMVRMVMLIVVTAIKMAVKDGNGGSKSNGDSDEDWNN